MLLLKISVAIFIAGNVLGMGLRLTLGPASAPTFAVSGVDERTIVMVALGVTLQTIAAVAAARVFARRAPIRDPVGTPSASANAGLA